MSLLFSPTSNDNYRISKGLFSEWRASEALCAIFAMIGIFIATVDYEYSYSLDRTHDNCKIGKMILDPMKVAILITTLISLFYLIIGIYHKALWEAYMNYVYSHGFHKVVTFKNLIREIRWYRWLEMIMLLIIPYPKTYINLYLPLRYQFNFYVICYSSVEICYLLMFFRIEIVLRAISLFSPYEDHLARNYCRKYKVPADARFGMKCLIAQYPLYVISISAIGALILLTTIFRILERPLDDLTTYYYSYYLNALWFLFENMSTLGYGEYLPVTDLGRVVTVFGFFCGTSLFSLMILTLNDKINLNIQQSKAFTKIFKTNVAAEAIAAGLIYFNTKKKHGKRSNYTKEKLKILRSKCKELKNKRVEVEELSKGNDEAIMDMKYSVSNIELKMRKADKALDIMISQLKEDAERRENLRL